MTPRARAYRGFAFVASVTTKGIDTGADVALQLRRGGSWRTISHADATGRTDEVAIKLSRSVRPGSYGLRARATVGDETLTSSVRRLRVRKAAGWTTSRRQDGRWKGKASGCRSGSGCPGAAARSARARSSSRSLPAGGDEPVHHADRGRAAAEGEDRTRRLVRVRGRGEQPRSFVHGRIHGRRATGKAGLSLGVCSGSARFSAKRS